MHLNEFCTLVEDLKDTGLDVPKDLLSILLLCSSPEEMENFIIAIESRDMLPSIDQLKVKIQEEEQRLFEGNWRRKAFLQPISSRASRSNYVTNGTLN